MRNQKLASLILAITLSAFLLSSQSVTAQVFPEPAKPKPAAKKKPAGKPTVKKRKNGTDRSVDAVVALPPPSPFVGAVPRPMTGTWLFRTTSGLLSSKYVVVVKIDGGDVGGPIGRVDYFMEGLDVSASHACGAQLWLENYDGINLVAEEKIENKGLFCPGGAMLRARISEPNLLLEFFKPPKKQGQKEKVTRRGSAVRQEPQR